ncbi:MAG: sigma-70 family RNA polymerase sigma factor [Anaerolineae bacterium]|nr:sigma-70 family RNA polymerase sigma factor [Anaerolineae bacterium]
MERTNEMWLADLGDDSPQQAEAIEDLRRYLNRGVMAYLRNRSDLRHLAATELQQMSQDFTQEALLKIQSNLDTFQGKSKFTTWATKIAANHTISELRRAKWRDLSLDAITEAGTALQEILDLDTAPGNNPDTASERRQVWETITHVIKTELTERQRQVLVSVQVENMPVVKVAELLETNANNIYKLLHDARSKLKRRLQDLELDPHYVMKLFSESG